MSHSLRYAVDWKSRPTVIFESDDWGACEFAPTRRLWQDQIESPDGSKNQPNHNARLETPEDMERLGDILSSVHDSEGRPACFTGFICLANPDFERMETEGAGVYRDRFVDEGFPPPWQGERVIEAWRRAMERGVFAPEFHSRFHHTNPMDWLALLRSDSEEGKSAQGRFRRKIYCQDRHYPEYRNMSRSELEEWISPAVMAFQRTFGFPPTAGVTSDATAEVEAVWANLGIRTFCLRNFSIPGAPPIVYHTKPWNNQDATTPMGAWNPETDVIYLSRNIFFEPGFDRHYSFETTMEHVRAVWERNEPAVFSTHRLNYVNYDAEIEKHSYAQLGRVLKALAAVPNVRFLTTKAVADCYRYSE